MWTLILKAAVAAALAFGVAYAAAANLPALPAPSLDDQPVRAEDMALIVPLWQHGRIDSFVSIGLLVDLKPGSNAALLLPAVRDRLLADLYEYGADGWLRPGVTNPEALRTTLLQAAATVSDSRVRELTLTQFIHQENSRRD